MDKGKCKGFPLLLYKTEYVKLLIFLQYSSHQPLLPLKCANGLRLCIL